MTTEEKQLLLKDLCARLPYDVIVHTWYNKPLNIKCTGIDLYTNTINLDIPNDDEAKVYIDNCKPYLRPMSSMTEEEDKEFTKLCYLYYEPKVNGVVNLPYGTGYAWLNAHHFDFRNLIEKGLALKAPKDMYKTE